MLMIISSLLYAILLIIIISIDISPTKRAYLQKRHLKCRRSCRRFFNKIKNCCGSQEKGITNINLLINMKYTVYLKIYLKIVLLIA